MKRLLVAAFALIAAVSQGAAAPEILQEASPGGVAYRRVALPDAPNQTLQLLWRDGTPLGVPGMQALPSFAPAMMHEGPKGEKRGEINELMRDLRGSFNFSMTSELTSLTLTAPPDTIDAVADVLKRFLENPGFPEKRLETFRRDRLTSLRQSQKNGEILGGLMRTRMLMDEGPYRSYFSNDAARYQRVSVADIAAWRQNVLARDNLVIASAGPMPAAAVGAMIDKLVSGLPAKANLAAIPPFRFVASTKRIVVVRDVAQTSIQAFGPVAVPAGMERVKANLALGRLGGGAQGRLFVALREKLGATYGVSASLSQPTLRGRALDIQTSVAHDKTKAVIEAIEAEYRRWREDGITEEELNAARSQQRSGWIESLKQPGTVASFTAYGEFLDQKAETFDGFGAAREAVTRAEVNAFIKERFPAWPLGMVIVAPSAEGLGADCVVKSLEDIEKCG